MTFNPRHYSHVIRDCADRIRRGTIGERWTPGPELTRAIEALRNDADHFNDCRVITAAYPRFFMLSAEMGAD